MRNEVIDPHGPSVEPSIGYVRPKGALEVRRSATDCGWLEKLGMSEYALRFAENRIDFFALPDLTDSDLKDLGVVLGDRRKIMRAIAKLDAAPEAAVLMAKPPSTLSVAAVQSLPIAEESSERRDVTPYGSFQESGDGHPRANYHRLLARAVKGLDLRRRASCAPVRWASTNSARRPQTNAH